MQRKVDRFKALGPEMRLQLLLQYSKKLPALPEELWEARDAGLNRVDECQTPLYLWVRVQDGRVRIHADAPEEAPTVRGFVSFLIDVLDGAEPADVGALPDDLLDRMGLGEVLGVMRTRGLGAVIHRVKRDAARAAAA